MTEKIAELSAWLQKFESEIPEHGSINNASDLMSKNKKFQVLILCEYFLLLCCFKHMLYTELKTFTLLNFCILKYLLSVVPRIYIFLQYAIRYQQDFKKFIFPVIFYFSDLFKRV